MKATHAAVMAGLALGLMSGANAAVAAPITYEFSGTATGNYGSTNFSNVGFKLDLRSDTNSIFSPEIGVTANTGPTFITIDGVTTNLFLEDDLADFVTDAPPGGVGIHLLGGSDLLDALNPILATYNFASSLAPTPVVVEFNGLQGGSVNGQTLNINEIDNLSFSATVSSVPLPSSAPMFGAALLALGAVGFGMKRNSKAAA